MVNHVKIKIIVARALNRLSIYSVFKNTPLGPCYLGTLLKNKGYDVEVLDEFLTRIHPNTLQADVINGNELLDLLQKAGCDLLYIGLESINEETLKEYNKKQKVETVMNCVDILHTYGIRLFALMIAGSDHDTVKTIRETSQFCCDRDIELVQITAYTPLPGTELYSGLQQENRLMDKMRGKSTPFQFDYRYSAKTAIHEPGKSVRYNAKLIFIYVSIPVAGNSWFTFLMTLKYFVT